MAVQVATLDLLTERAHFDPEVARAVGDAISMEMSSSQESFATRHDLAMLRQEVYALRTDVRAEMKELRSELRAEIKQEGANVRADVVRWMFTALAGQTALLAGLMYFMLQHLR